MRFCTTHRACETAEDGTCEVHLVVAAILLRLRPNDWTVLSQPCTLVDALIVKKDTGGWPEAVLKVGDNYAGRIGTGLFLDALERAEP